MLNNNTNYTNSNNSFDSSTLFTNLNSNSFVKDNFFYYGKLLKIMYQKENQFCKNIKKITF